MCRQFFFERFTQNAHMYQSSKQWKQSFLKEIWPKAKKNIVIFSLFSTQCNYSKYMCWVFTQECHQSSNKNQFRSGLCQPKSQRMALFRKGCHGYFAEVDGTRQDAWYVEQSNRVQTFWLKDWTLMFMCFQHQHLSFCKLPF